MSLKLQAKFKSADEIKYVLDAAKYVKMTEKQFLRVAALKLVESLHAEVRRRTDEARNKLDEESVNVGNNSEEVNQPAEGGEQSDGNTSST